jgi:ATP-dependent RNA helicase DeaD
MTDQTVSTSVPTSASDTAAAEEGQSKPEPTALATSEEPAVTPEPAATPETPEAVASDSEVQTPAVAEPATVNAEPTFNDLPLHAQVLEAVVAKGYDQPTPIQAQIIPHMLAGRDVLAQSQTGTGKTAAFALPILSRVDTNKPKTQVLVLAPTRELAIQVAKSFSTYGAQLPQFSVAAIYGGQDYEPQLKQLRRGAHVVVGTPGRVIDHIKRGTLNLDNIDTLVLDEADEMLNMGFLEDVQFVLEQAPEKRQVALFSATLPEPIRKISKRYLNDPAKITIKQSKTDDANIRQRALFVSPRDKMDVLMRFLEVEQTDGVIVFTKTKDATVTVADKLIREGQKAVALNGDMPQRTRERTIENFRNGHLNILVATDVAARGLDVQRVSHVFNFDLPHDNDSYVHRIGRTGRAGRKGDAIIFLTGAQRGKLRQLERVAKQSIEVVDPPTSNDINSRRVERFCERIDQVTAARDLTVFKELIAKYADESGKPMEMIAAALAQIAQQGRPFLIKEQPKPKREKFERRDNDRGEGRGERGGRRQQREVRPTEEGMTRYRIQVGHRDGVKPGNIVGAIANEAGIDGECIGAIQIQDAYTTVDLPEGMPEETFHALQSTRVVGKPMRLGINRENQEGERSGNERSYGGGHKKSHGPHKGKPHGGNKSGSTKPFVLAGGPQPHHKKKKKRKAKV